jgi:hypothetical protein
VIFSKFVKGEAATEEEKNPEEALFKPLKDLTSYEISEEGS